MTWGHDQLAGDLAEHLRRNQDVLAWEDMQLGSSGSPRPDVYVLPKSYANFKPIAYECKVSVSDFRSDITTGKWQSYLKFASAVVFAVPAGLIGKNDIPNGCGLVVRGDGGWRTLKAPRLERLDTLPREAWIKLLIDGTQREARRMMPPVRQANAYAISREVSKRYGDRIGALLFDLSMAETRLKGEISSCDARIDAVKKRTQEEIAREKARSDRESSDLDAKLKALALMLGLNDCADLYDVRNALSEAMRRINEADYVKSLRRAIATIEGDLRTMKEKLPPEQVEVPA